MSAPTTSKTSQDSKPEPGSTTDEAPVAVAAKKPYKPFTTKAREFLGMHTDEDVALLQNDMIRFGGSVIVTAVNPAAGAAAFSYSAAASYRDRSRVKAAKHQVEEAPSGNHSA